MQDGNHAAGRHCKKLAMLLQEIKFEITNDTITRLSHYQGVGQKSLTLIEEAMKSVEDESSVHKDEPSRKSKSSEMTASCNDNDDGIIEKANNIDLCIEAESNNDDDDTKGFLTQDFSSQY